MPSLCTRLQAGGCAVEQSFTLVASLLTCSLFALYLQTRSWLTSWRPSSRCSCSRWCRPIPCLPWCPTLPPSPPRRPPLPRRRPLLRLPPPLLPPLALLRQQALPVRPRPAAPLSCPLPSRRQPPARTWWATSLVATAPRRPLQLGPPRRLQPRRLRQRRHQCRTSLQRQRLLTLLARLSASLPCTR